MSNGNSGGSGCGCFTWVLLYLPIAWYFSWYPCLSGGFDITKFESDYNVYFYYPSGKEEYLGVANGVADGQDFVYSFAEEKGYSLNTEWDYILCRITRTSDCEEKVK